MKPINLNTAPCVPMSSNCVIWQGDNIPCINLCHGDTVSDVVFKLATELCTIMDQLNVSNYDLTCFGITACGPNDFQTLIQFLITQICELQGVTPTTKENTTGCPDCLVTVAPCFVVGGQTTMNLTDYVNMIAEKICDIVDELVIINAALVDLNTRVTTLENAIPPSFTIPSYITDCQIGSLAPANWDIDVILEAFTNEVWCSFYGATGTTNAILAAVAAECVEGTFNSLSIPGSLMQVVYPDWNNVAFAPNTLASTINRLWISLCDMRTSLLNSSVVVEGSEWIDVVTTTVGTDVTYTVSEIGKPGLSVYLAPPSNLLKTTPDQNTGRLCDGQTQIMTGIDYNDFLTDYDVSTGLFTTPETGVYTISFFVSYTNNGTTGWYNAATPGMIIAGITSPVTCDFLCVNNYTPVVTQKYASINGSMTRTLIKGRQICLKVINLTSYDYTSISGDVVRMSIQRVN